MSATAAIWKASSWAARTKKGYCDEVSAGSVAAKDTSGTRSSFTTTLRLVPLSTVESRLMSSTASWMAVAAELPMTESKVKRAPMVTLGGRAGRATARALHRHSTRRSRCRAISVQNSL
nr:unnamed protein product [Digitaria exilis]